MRAVEIKTFIYKTIALLWLSGVFTLGASCSTGKNPVTHGAYPLASVTDPPSGKEGVSGEESGIYLGYYKTCKEYANFMLAQAGFFVRYIFFPLISGLQNFSTVKCKNAHTCHCKNNFYFSDQVGNKASFYQCVETPDAQVESDEVYRSNESFPEDGVIKFALPTSFCEKQK